MKVCLVCPPLRNYPCSKFEWVGDAFARVGHDVLYASTLDEVADADKTCDLLLFFHKSAGLSITSLVQMAASKRATWVQWWFDLIALDAGKSLGEQWMFQQFAALLRAMDAVLVKEEDLLDDYRGLGVNAIWFDQACPSNMPACEYAKKPEWDVLVLGDAGRRNRREDAKALADAGLRVLWAGRPSTVCIPPGIDGHPWVHPLELPKLISRCGVVLGVDWRCDLRGYTSDRTWLAMGAGACYAIRLDDAERLKRSACLYYEPPITRLGVNLIGGTCDLLERRKIIGTEARELTMQNHTYERRAEQLAELFDAGKFGKAA